MWWVLFRIAVPQNFKTLQFNLHFWVSSFDIPFHGPLALSASSNSSGVLRIATRVVGAGVAMLGLALS